MRMLSTNRLAVPLLFLLCTACGAPARDAETRETAEVRPEPPAPAPWTETFMAPATLVAEEVRIEGPPGLIEHVAVAQDPDNISYVSRAVPQGLLQEWTVKPSGSDEPIRGRMDALDLAVTRRLVVLERPAAVPLVVEARGEVWWRRESDGREQRGASLRLVGDGPR
jgi:hypothetical protein